MPSKKISDVASSANGAITVIDNAVYVPVAVSNGAGGFLSTDHVVRLDNLVTLLGEQVDTRIQNYIEEEEVVVDIGTVTDFLTPTSTASAFLPPSIWISMFNEVELIPVSNNITFDPLVSTASLNFISTITANSNISVITKANMVTGMPYRLEVKASGADCTLGFTALVAGDATAGAAGPVVIRSGDTRDFILRKRADGSVKITIGAPEDV